jgi:dGTPase
MGLDMEEAVDMPNLRLITRKEKEEAERQLIRLGLLSPMYTLSSDSKGRARKERESAWRTCFERDVDRIIYSMAYRRMRNKTQVVLLPMDQHLTTRMIHTEEVYQVARGICSFLGLNRVLAEAIARGHDLGHTPFGHAGEEVLTEIIRELTGNKKYKFHHAKYGLEIVDRVEKNGRGLNLTYEVKDGIGKHSDGKKGLDAKVQLPATPEGRVARISDKISYVCSDLDDLLRVGVIKRSRIPKSALKLLGPRKSRWIGTLNRAVVGCSLATGDIAFYGDVYGAFEEIRQFMYDTAYGKGEMEKEFEKARETIRSVFMRVMETEFSGLDQKVAAFKALDVVACMTDQSILKYYVDNFVPRGPY